MTLNGAAGGKGHNGAYTTGGNGAKVAMTLSVVPGQNLHCYVGCSGSTSVSANSGFNGGGSTALCSNGVSGGIGGE